MKYHGLSITLWKLTKLVSINSFQYFKIINMIHFYMKTVSYAFRSVILQTSLGSRNHGFHQRWISWCQAFSNSNILSYLWVPYACIFLINYSFILGYFKWVSTTYNQRTLMKKTVSDSLGHKLIVSSSKSCISQESLACASKI